MNVSVIGCGRWGSFIAWYLAGLGHNVLLYGRPGSPHMNAFLDTRSNGLVTLGPNVSLTQELSEALSRDIIVISVNSQGLRNLAKEIAAHSPAGKTFVLCMKGLEAGTGLRLTQVIRKYMPPSCRVAVWLGPGHVQEFVAGIPNCMVIDSESTQTKETLVEAFSGPLIRFYYGNDLVGNEIGAAAKNIVGIAAGTLDGLGLSSLKGALMSRGTREIARLIKALGGSELSAYGLCHLGDYEATVFSKFSHNRAFGEALVRRTPYTELAEGAETARAFMKLSAETGIELPICSAVHKVIYEGVPPEDAIKELFLRDLKMEF